MLGDKPLIMHTIETIHDSGYTANIFTNEKNILYEPNLETYWNIIERPEELSTSKTTMKETVQGFINHYNHWKPMHERILDTDVILLTYLTCPFRDAEDIKNAINKFYRHKAKSLQSLSRVDYRPYGLMEAIDKKEACEYGKFKCLQDQKEYYQSQNTPRLFRANGAIYIFKVSELDKLNNQMFNEDTIGFVLSDTHGLDIDTKLDLMLAEAILRERHEHTINKLSYQGESETEHYTNGTCSNIPRFETNRT